MNGTELAALIITLLFITGIVLVLRLPKSGLLDDRVESLDINKNGLSLRRRIQDAGQQLAPGYATSAPPADERTPSDSSYLATIQGIAKWSPSAAVVEAGGRLEHTLRELVPALPSGRPMALRAMLDSAVQAEMLTQQERNAFAELLVVRNAAAHGEAGDLDQKDALKFAELARQIAMSVRLSVGQVSEPGREAL